MNSKVTVSVLKVFEQNFYGSFGLKKYLYSSGINC